MAWETHSVPSGQLRSLQDTATLFTHCGPSSVSVQMDPFSHTNWSQFRAILHLTLPPVRLCSQNSPGPHETSLQSVGTLGRTHLVAMNCRHWDDGRSSRHVGGLISSTHCLAPGQSLSLHLLTGQRSVTFNPPSQKKFGVHKPWQGFTRHSALRNRGHCSPSQLSGQSELGLGQSSWATTAVAITIINTRLSILTIFNSLNTGFARAGIPIIYIIHTSTCISFRCLQGLPLECVASRRPCCNRAPPPPLDPPLQRRVQPLGTGAVSRYVATYHLAPASKV